MSKRSEAAAIPRYHSLDRLRAVAMLLGVVLHSSVHYFVLPAPELQVYLDRNTSRPLELLFSFIHAYRMPVFFVIAGFFAAFLLDTRGAKAFALHRLNRIAVPLAVGTLVLFPLVALCTFYAQLSTTGPRMTEADIGMIVDGLFMHLWFLYHLLLFSAAATGVCHLASGLPERVREAAVETFGRIVQSPVAPIVLAAPAALGLFQMDFWTFDYSSSPLPPPRLLSVYGLYFVFGWFLFKRRDVLGGFRARAWGHLLAGVVLFGLYRYFYAQKAGPDAPPIEHLLAVVCLALSVWLVIYASLGLFQRYLDKPSAVWRYVSDASYWVYLIHLPITIALAPVLASVDVFAEIKFAFVFLTASVMSLLSYHYLVRDTFIGARLNGRRYPRVAPWRQAAS